MLEETDLLPSIGITLGALVVSMAVGFAWRGKTAALSASLTFMAASASNPFTVSVSTNAGLNTRFAGVSLLYADEADTVLTGTDTVTGQVFTPGYPRLWNVPHWRADSPSLRTIPSKTGWWDLSVASGVNGPGGTNNESVLRIRRLADFTNPPNPQCGFYWYPQCTSASQMGMIYMRYKQRIANFASGASSYGTLGYFKTGSAGETSSRRLYIGCSRDSSYGWLLRVQSSNANSSYPGGRAWGGATPLGPGLVPTAPASYWYDSSGGFGAGQGEIYFYKGVFTPYSGGGLAPEPDWRQWVTVEFAMRVHSTTGEVAGGAGSTGWVWVATAAGTASAAAPNGTGACRFYLAGPNVYDATLIESTDRAGLFGNNIYGGAYPTNVDLELGSLEVYDYWPADASEHPAEAI